MKPTVLLLFLLACCGVLLGDASSSGSMPRKPSTLLEDLVRLTRTGSSEVTVLAYAKAHRLELPPELNDSDLAWLRDSGVSERVVSYMTAIDVRASSQLKVASGSVSAARRRASVLSSESDSDDSSGGSSNGYAGSVSSRDEDAYDYDYDPSYDYGSYPYPVYFFAGRPGFFGRFQDRNHRFGRGVAGHGGFRDAWRERNFNGRRGNPIVVRPRGPVRPAFARGTFGAAGPRGHAAGHRGIGPPGSARGSFARGFEPRGGSAFSGGPHAGSGLGGGRRVATGSSGGHARR